MWTPAEAGRLRAAPTKAAAQAFLPLLAVAVLAPVCRAQIYSSSLPVDHPAIRYAQEITDDPIARLARQLDSGKTTLDYREGGLGYLPSLLDHLGVHPDSQALVFSKTSFQATRISPRNPRAIYFGDDVAVGWVRGGEGFELAGLDPKQGVIFYTLAVAKSDRPRIVRRTDCLHCHQGAATLGVPGIFVGSVYPDSFGNPARQGAIITDHRTSFQDRWGGWYVNATRGQQPDRANAVAPDPAEPEVLKTEGRQNLTSLAKEFSTAGYLTPVSDIIALMTFEHQTQMTNLMTRLNWEARIPETKPAEIESDIRAIVAYMLFADEAPLREPIQGVSTFTRTFPQRGPRDHRGRSLRDFDLETRLFRYPLSYMIYSAAFDNLPPSVRDPILQQLYDVLAGKGQSEKFAGLSGADRRAILEILQDTKPNLPAYWRAFVKP
jgi:hypothetical protein